ncbi:hypothetical protein A6D98_06165 [Aliivibrio fischeri]|uniref:type II toxin-antitoxin system YhaV family toxin n=1 Tax=Aliivibrio fischeri TaxID=668 RepID=UPI00080D975A|nr:type II toxin-antitoxin system YhaV family toxin [Aliivibrio fischeri]OCH05874.1 hypothetical protein A6E10_07355 [Aliivibrio fischeri]OCH27440.1 hypothetical protein A6E13_06750 [Aliivibrio fischeri]OCH62584.1 hypothetical protein A6D98_06165 [Aliivibrio fischeri]
MSTAEVQIRNGYELHTLNIFQDILFNLVDEAEKIMAKDPEHFHTHPKIKLLSAVFDAISSSVPEDPNNNDFRQGLTLGKKYKSWRRVKKKLPPRYRLFFQFDNTPPKTIIYAWLNDDSTLRKTGAKTDVYKVFEKMLKNNTIPTSWDELMAEADPLKTEKESS